MRRLLSILILATFTLYVLNAPLTWSVYGLFADRIAEELCVNPDNPCCHGRCYINGSIRKQEESKSLTPNIPLSPEKILLYIDPHTPCEPLALLTDRLLPADPVSPVRPGWASLFDPPPRHLS